MFTASPFRPTGVATSDQAMANAVELLEWCTSLVADSVRERDDLSGAPAVERELRGGRRRVLRDSGALLAGGSARPDLERLEELPVPTPSAGCISCPRGPDGFREQPHRSRSTRTRSRSRRWRSAPTPMVAARVADAGPDRRGRAAAGSGGTTFEPATSRRQAVFDLAGLAVGNASLRSVWFLNSLRGALALAAAVAVADLTSVQHGFWVVLGTLSVLRTNASATGSTALRALPGTASASWSAARSCSGDRHATRPRCGSRCRSRCSWPPTRPGRRRSRSARPRSPSRSRSSSTCSPRSAGRSAWCGSRTSRSAARSAWSWACCSGRGGVAAVVGDDLADAFRSGAAYLTQAVEWAARRRARSLPTRRRRRHRGAALDEALRGLLAEQGTKHSQGGPLAPGRRLATPAADRPRGGGTPAP